MEALTVGASFISSRGCCHYMNILEVKLIIIFLNILQALCNSIKCQSWCVPALRLK